MVDGYFPFLEHLGDALEDLEDEVLLSPTQAQMKRVHEIRRQLLVLRRSLWPQREAINLLTRDAIEVISKDTRVYFRDCYDHTVQLVDLTENQRELSSALMELYLSQQSQKLNEVMKLLAVISTFFMPLSFIAGLYGMNFHGSPFNMPELTWTYGYFFALGLMALTALGLFAMFRKQGWL
jgi:magnesium transporter